MATYAIIQSGGKQYRVSAGDVIDVELLSGEKGSKVRFEDVLFHQNENGSKIGSPALADVVVHGEVIDFVRGPKIIAYKYKKRKRSTRRKVGHRQDYARVKITEV